MAAEDAAGAPLGAPPPDGAAPCPGLPEENCDHFHDYASLTSLLQDTRCGSILRVFSIGRSAQGRELWAVRLSDNPDAKDGEPEFLYAANIHGDETLGRELLVNLLRDMCARFAAGDAYVRWLVEETDIYMVMSLNPDGHEAGTRYNSNGVDLNRNFPDQVANETAELQPETRAAVNFMRQHTFALGATLHAGALVCNYPWDGYSSGLPGRGAPSLCPDDALYGHICSAYSGLHPRMRGSQVFRGGITNGAEYFAMYGGFQDWSYSQLGMMHVTLELGDEKSPGPQRLGAEWAANRRALYGLIAQVHAGARGRVLCACGAGPARPATKATLTFLPGAPPRACGAGCGAAPPPLAQEIATRADPSTGHYHRVLLPGNYTVRVEADCSGVVTATRTLTLLAAAGGPGTRAVAVDFRLAPAAGCGAAELLADAAGAAASGAPRQAWASGRRGGGAAPARGAAAAAEGARLPAGAGAELLCAAAALAAALALAAAGCWRWRGGAHCGRRRPSSPRPRGGRAALAAAAPPAAPAAE